MSDAYIKELESRMDGAIASLQHSLNGLRTGRASVALLDGVQVNAYGSRMPISQVGTLNTPEARLITIQVWDSAMIDPVVKAIQESGLGLNPSADGQLIRVPLPELSQERRKEFAKKASEYGEAAKIAVRNVRRDGNDHFKKLEKEKEISEDDSKRHTSDVQKLTDAFIAKIDAAVEKKSKEILEV